MIFNLESHTESIFFHRSQIFKEQKLRSHLQSPPIFLNLSAVLPTALWARTVRVWALKTDIVQSSTVLHRTCYHVGSRDDHVTWFRWWFVDVAIRIRRTEYKAHDTWKEEDVVESDNDGMDKERKRKMGGSVERWVESTLTDYYISQLSHRRRRRKEEGKKKEGQCSQGTHQLIRRLIFGWKRGLFHKRKSFQVGSFEHYETTRGTFWV